MKIEGADFEIPPEFPSELSSRLRYRDDASDSIWSIWEYKTLSIHRSVLIWHPGVEKLTFEDMSLQIFARVKATFHISWWRGFAFGVFIDASYLPDDLDRIESTIQTRAFWGPVWQWTVLACDQRGIAIGVHTWTEGYLSNIFRALLNDYRRSGFCVGSFKKDKDQLMQFLTTIGSLHLPEFHK